MDPDFAKKFFELTDAATSIIITSHTSPDDDSISSVLSIYRLLSQKYLNKKIRVVYSGTKIDRYTSFAGFDKVEFVDDLANHFDDCDLLIGLDASQFSRFSKKPDADFSKFKSICIDHHSSPPSEFTLKYINSVAAANAQNIYELFFKGQKFDKDMAEIVLLGLLGDTRNFAYLRPENLSALDMGKDLLTVANCDIQEFRARYSQISERVFSIVVEYVKNTQFAEVATWPKFMYSYLIRDFKDQGQFTDNEISEASHIYVDNYQRLIFGYDWGFNVSPKTDGSCSLSCRSLPGSLNVRLFSESVANGGGHDRAAGGTFPNSQPEECIEKIKKWMETNKPVLS